MDLLDKISLGAIVLLGVAAASVVADHATDPGAARNRKPRLAAAAAPASSAETDGAVKLAKNLMESDNPGKAEVLMRELIGKHPYEAQLHMALGDALMRKQEPLKAIFAYREAVDLNPDYLDKKTPLFQGKKLKVAAAEAVAELETLIRRNPGDDALKKDRKIIHYLQRRIAGSCS